MSIVSSAATGFVNDLFTNAFNYDLSEVADEIKNSLTITPVASVAEVLT